MRRTGGGGEALALVRAVHGPSAVPAMGRPAVDRRPQASDLQAMHPAAAVWAQSRREVKCTECGDQAPFRPRVWLASHTDALRRVGWFVWDSAAPVAFHGVVICPDCRRVVPGAEKRPARTMTAADWQKRSPPTQPPTP